MAGSGYRDYFKVLGVDRGADADAIKRAFRKLARQYHPDVNPGDKAAEAKFKEVSEAYEVLSDPDKRRRYEQFGQYWNQAGAGAERGRVALTSISVATATSTTSSMTCSVVSEDRVAVGSAEHPEALPVEASRVEEAFWKQWFRRGWLPPRRVTGAGQSRR